MNLRRLMQTNVRLLTVEKSRDHESFNMEKIPDLEILSADQSQHVESV